MAILFFVFGQNEEDSTDLVNYVERGDLISAQKCLDSGVGINSFRQEGWSGDRHNGATALIVAIEDDSLSKVQWVIDNGGDVNQKAGGYGYPITQASVQGNMDIIRELEKSGVKFDVIFLDMKCSEWARNSGHSDEFITYLLERESLDY